jgi:hypothetical protein
MDWDGLGWTEMDWDGLRWTEMDWTPFESVIQLGSLEWFNATSKQRPGHRFSGSGFWLCRPECVRRVREPCPLVV